MAYSPNRHCKECGCRCETCHMNNSLHLHKEIEDLKHQLLQREYCLLQMETSVLMAAEKYPKGEFVALREEIDIWQEKYERLLEGHKKLQRVNQGLEDKLLKIVDKYETEKAALNRDVSSLTSRLIEARISVAELEEENEHYRNDCSIAVQLLQCKPSNFVSHRLESFPVEFQQHVQSHLGQKRQNPCNGNQVPSSSDVRTIRVPIPTFPPTAMVYSVNKPANENEEESELPPADVVSAAIMAKVLEERAKERNERRASSSKSFCRCGGFKSLQTEEKAVQTQWTASLDISEKTTHLLCECKYGHPCQKRPEISVSTEHSLSRQWSYNGSSTSTTSTETEI